MVKKIIEDNILSNVCDKFVGEFIGTFILVFFGCASVANSVLFSSFTSVFQIAIIWGIGVSIAIYATRHLSCAHLNPAVSLAMVLSKRMKPSRLFQYWSAQFLGAIAASLLLFLIFGNIISQYEVSNSIIRGTSESIKTARIFGEYFAVEGYEFSTISAFIVEMIGTLVLVTIIFTVTEGCNLGRPSDNIAPLIIGISIAAIICITAPMTQTGLNPARDWGPRIVSYLFGWYGVGQGQNLDLFFVYFIGPLVGGSIAAMIFVYIIDPMMGKAKKRLMCCE